MDLNANGNEPPLPENDGDEELNYLIPEIHIDLHSGEDEDTGFADGLLFEISQREDFVMSVLAALQEKGLENSPQWNQYQTELYMLLALENQHNTLIANESVDSPEEDDEEDDDNDLV